MSRSLLLAACASALLAAACGGSTSSNAPGAAGAPGSGGAPGTAGAPGTVSNDGGVPGDSGVPSTGNCPAAPTVVVGNLDYPSAVAADNQYVYWTVDIMGAPTAPIRSEVLRVPAGACNAKPSVFVSTSETYTLTLDADQVFWADADGVASRPKAGGPITRLAPGGDGPLFADGTDLFFTVNIGGTTGTTSLHMFDLATHKNSVLYSGSGYIQGIAANAQSVFFTSTSGPAGVAQVDSVWRVPRAGGNASAIATGQLAPSGIAVDAKAVYWVDGGNSGVDIWTGGGSLMREPLAGGTPTPLAGNLVGPTSLAIDAKDAFVAGFPVETEQIPLLRVPLAGGTPAKLVPAMSGAPSGAGVAVNDTAVYYLTRDSVKRVAKSYSP